MWLTTRDTHTQGGPVVLPTSPIWQLGAGEPRSQSCAGDNRRLISGAILLYGVGTGFLQARPKHSENRPREGGVFGHVGTRPAQVRARKAHDTGEEEKSSTLKDRDIKREKVALLR